MNYIIIGKIILTIILMLCAVKVMIQVLEQRKPKNFNDFMNRELWFYCFIYPVIFLIPIGFLWGLFKA